jgi:hypothetical protein
MTLRELINSVDSEQYSDSALYQKLRKTKPELELTTTLDDDAVSYLCCQFSIPADYDGLGAQGSKFVFYL